MSTAAALTSHHSKRAAIMGGRHTLQPAHLNGSGTLDMHFSSDPGHNAHHARDGRKPPSTHQQTVLILLILCLWQSKKAAKRVPRPSRSTSAPGTTTSSKNGWKPGSFCRAGKSSPCVPA